MTLTGYVVKRGWWGSQEIEKVKLNVQLRHLLSKANKVSPFRKNGYDIAMVVKWDPSTHELHTDQITKRNTIMNKEEIIGMLLTRILINR